MKGIEKEIVESIPFRIHQHFAVYWRFKSMYQVVFSFFLSMKESGPQFRTSQKGRESSKEYLGCFCFHLFSFFVFVFPTPLAVHATHINVYLKQKNSFIILISHLLFLFLHHFINKLYPHPLINL